MRHLIAILLLASSSWGAIALVSHPAAVINTTAGTTCANGVGITGNTTAGELYGIVVSIAHGGSVSSVTDNGTGGANTYTAGPIADNASGGHVEIWYSFNPAHSATTITASFTSQTNSCAAFEYSGVGAIAFEVIKAGASSTTASASTYTNQANSLIVSGFSDALSTASWTAATGTLEANATGTATTAGIAYVDRSIAAVGTGGNTTSATLSVAQAYAAASMELTPSALSGWTFLGHGWATCTSSTSCAITYAPRAGNVLIFWLNTGVTAGNAISSVTNETVTSCSACNGSAASVGSNAASYTLNSSAATSVTVNWGTSASFSWTSVEEFSYTGSATLSLDAGGFTGAQATSTTPAGQGLTLTGANDVISQDIQAGGGCCNVNAMSTAAYIDPRDLNSTTGFTAIGFAGAINTSSGSAPAWGMSATGVTDVSAIAIKAVATSSSNQMPVIY